MELIQSGFFVSIFAWSGIASRRLMTSHRLEGCRGQVSRFENEGAGQQSRLIGMKPVSLFKNRGYYYKLFDIHIKIGYTEHVQTMFNKIGVSMNTREQDTRQLIIDTAKMLLDEAEDIEKITVRQIAERADIGIGLINYHFKSKDNLLSLAIGDIMAETILDFSKSGTYADLEPVEKLKGVLKELYILSDKKEKLMHFILSRDIMNGNMQTPLHLIPLLKEIFGDRKDDIQLRILALQILYPIQVTGLNKEAFYMYSGMDVSDKEQRSCFIDNLINNLISGN